MVVMDKPLSRQVIDQALKTLDHHLSTSLRLIMGGGGAMIMAHNYPLSTTDIDAIPMNSSIEELDPLIKQISVELSLPGDWLNPYFSTFSYVLPQDYGSRLIRVFQGNRLSVDAIGREDMLIMKCFAHRAKDVGHSKALIKAGVNLDLVEDRIFELDQQNYKGAKEALRFLDEILESLDERT